MRHNRNVPGVLNLAIHHLAEDSPESAQAFFDMYTHATQAVQGAGAPTLWKRVTGEELLVITLFPDLDTLNECENQFVMTRAFERFVRQTEQVEDIDRFSIIHHQGSTPDEVPIGGYCSTNSHIAGPGFVQDELTESRYILDSLWQIEGFLGAYVGRSLMAPSRLDSLAFWGDVAAAEKAIPIRVETNLRMYRRLF